MDKNKTTWHLKFSHSNIPSDILITSNRHFIEYLWGLTYVARCWVPAHLGKGAAKNQAALHFSRQKKKKRIIRQQLTDKQQKQWEEEKKWKMDVCNSN